jgi:hypothetical protein
MPPNTVDFVSMRKTWAVLGLHSRGRVGSTDDGIGSTMQALFRGRVGLIDDGIGSTTLKLFKGGVGLTDDRTRSTTWVSFSKGRMGSTGGKRIDHFGVTL